MSADILRSAAALMRSRAEVGGPLDYPPPWRVEKCDVERYGLASIVTCHEDGSGDVTDRVDDSIAEYIAAVDPTFLLAVADLLETAAAVVGTRDAADVDPLALAVATAYLGNPP